MINFDFRWRPISYSLAKSIQKLFIRLAWKMNIVICCSSFYSLYSEICHFSELKFLFLIRYNWKYKIIACVKMSNISLIWRGTDLLQVLSWLKFLLTRDKNVDYRINFWVVILISLVTTVDKPNAIPPTATRRKSLRI